MTFSQTLRRLREQSGRTATELAQAAGISRQALAMLEAGTRQPSLETAKKLMAALGKSLSELER
jgi:DNA-binding XRE family transcriptional regulator